MIKVYPRRRDDIRQGGEADPANVTPRAVRGLVWGLGLLVVTSCGGDSAQGDLAQPETAAPPILDVEDTVLPPDVEPDTSLDSTADDTDGTDAIEPDTSGLAAGEDCQEDAQCLSGHCLFSRQGRQCAAPCEDACEGDLLCVRVGADKVCVDPFATRCLPCDSHAECNLGAAAGLSGEGGNRCVTQGASRACAIACGPERGCGEGESCVDGLCRPLDGACECTPLALLLEASSGCGCGGVRTCKAVGEAISECEGQGPGPEVCNGRDDDCDGAVDGDLCGDYACLGEAGCKTSCETNADCRPGLGCDRDDVDGDGVVDECLPNGDNGTSCDGDEECQSGECKNDFCCPAGVGQALCCARDADCTSLDRPGTCLEAGTCSAVSTVGRCEGFVCVSRQVSTPELCAGQVCRAGGCTGGAGGTPVYDGPHLCDGDGACMPTADRACDDGDACTLDTCGPSGCEVAPWTGTTDEACYTSGAATRGKGLCRDGVVTCEAGTAVGCAGEVGPVAEVCNGEDDDCDGQSDEDTELSCFPYLCGGETGCGSGCEVNTDCAAGNFCQLGRCVGTGEDGAACEDGDQCASGYCSQGVCCASDLCCVSDSQCGALDEVMCESTDPTGCFGLSLRGICLGDNRCEAVASVDPGACGGEPCKESRCDGASVVAASVCTATGQCVVGGPTTSCAPYACRDGACKVGCTGNSDCSAGTCIDGECSGLPNGAACSGDGQCATGRCNNGFCCASGTCCNGDNACAGLTQPATCTNAGSCGGSQVVGVCGPAFSCQTTTRSAPEACLGLSCGAPRCLNLTGLAVVLEGVERKTCNAAGSCVTSTRDCRDFEDTSYCSENSEFYIACQGCSPKRATCVVFDNPCYCE